MPEGKPNIPLQNLKFGMDITEFKETENKEGTFEGLLVNYNHANLARGYYKFLKGSMKGNEGKTLLLLYNHCGNNIPVGTLQGAETEEGFKITAKFQLTKDGDSYLNKDAAALYDLLKNQGAKLQLSAGGTITDGEYKQEIKNGKTIYYYEIKKFEAYEGSITPKAAVQGSNINKVFSQGEENMDKNELIQLLTQQFSEFQKEMMKAKDDEEIMKLPQKFSDLEKSFDGMKDSLSKELLKEFSDKFNEIDDVIKGLKVGFKATEGEIKDSEAFYSMIQTCENTGLGVDVDFNSNEEITNFTAAEAATTGNSSPAIKPQYADRILKRIQEKNDVAKRISFIPTDETSFIIPREMLGLPECGIVGEEATREDTKGIKLDNVTIALYQFYCMPVLSNKLLAANFVGYLDFLMSRIEYAWSKYISDKMFTGTGVQQPTGILKDTNIAEYTLAPDKDLADAILEIYYSLDSDIAKKATWDMSTEMWTEIAKLKNARKDFYITDLNTGNVRTLMTRPVNIVDGVFTKPSTATAGDFLLTFGYWEEGMLGLYNPGLDMRLEDRITKKGFTKYYMEKLLGFGIQLPENFIRVKKQ
ncbi:phage major capsid protein, HK97 family [Cetobacterium ceti]|uniref:Phage major capsid protein, HK97 family n=1 Tax=Cetobacterium ceti TaxID=180163 RepID=A0A1T4QSL6_9FUSO|nr:phage major capsid protein [Cetobacterium ceti]SKA06752.1 phage major capsid protein, HK97 family [Cetobacterium ceti]